jgi:hypothetical protein
MQPGQEEKRQADEHEQQREAGSRRNSLEESQARNYIGSASHPTRASHQRSI